eukprot:m.44390 g.44390  ORF g.44390 m.44390 type:complete len:213 (-) comp8530_c0_seq2:1802-2440(-)
MADVMDVDDVLFGSLPDGMDMPVGGKELAQYQLEMFDIEVEARIEQMEAEIKKLIAKFEREFSVSMFKIPKDVREMKMGYLMDEFGGDISAVKKKDIHKKMEDAKAMPPPPPPSTARRLYAFPSSNLTVQFKETCWLQVKARGESHRARYRGGDCEEIAFFARGVEGLVRGRSSVLSQTILPKGHSIDFARSRDSGYCEALHSPSTGPSYIQ